MKKILIGIAVVVILGALYGVSVYNSVVTQGQAVDSQWAKVESSLQRRFDLIPNLVNSVKGTLKQEQAIFTAIAEARTQYAGATTLADKSAAASQMETGLGRLIAIVENYPVLKSSEAVQTLMTQLEGSENRINTERGRYNEFVQGYNTLVVRFPGSMFAKMYGFTAKEYFQADKAAAVVPSVNL
ncbi:MAG: LemA family protein [Patescibacteria group bacterium]